MSHKRFSPSGSGRWLECTGSIKLIESLDLPNSTNDASELGTAVHKIGEFCLRDDNEQEAKKYLGEVINDQKITQDCIDAVEIYIEYCRDLMFLVGDSNCLIEGQFTHPDIEDLGGTADFACFDLDNYVIEIVDYKNGTGHAYWAESNTQLMIYALLYYYNLKKFYKKSTVKKIRLTICQPRHRLHQDDDGLDSWDITLDDLLTWEKETLLPSIKQVDAKNAVYMPSDDACRWCDAKNVCPAVNSIVDDFKELMLEDKLVDEEPEQENRIKWVLDNEKLLTQFIKNAKALTMEKCLSGEDYAERKVVQGLCNRSYSIDGDKVLNMAIAGFDVTMARHDLMVPTTVLPPAQLEKKLKGFGVSKGDIAAFMKPKTERLEGAKQLVKLSAKGDAVTNEDDFEKMCADDES